MIASPAARRSWHPTSLLLVLSLGLATLGNLALLPGAWWWRQRLRPVGRVRLLAQQLGAVLAALLVAAVLLWLTFQDVASLMRNHKTLRYMINPFNTVYAVGRVAVGRNAHAGKPLQPVGTDAQFAGTPAAADTAPLIVLVVGETARAANFGLGGYERDTTPRLKTLQAQGGMVYFSDVTSCGTNTQTSVPCMFSPLGRQGYLDADGPYENLLDVLQRAGLAVLWLDNQSGCKGVGERVPALDQSSRGPPTRRPYGRCLAGAWSRQRPEARAAL